MATKKLYDGLDPKEHRIVIQRNDGDARFCHPQERANTERLCAMH